MGHKGGVVDERTLRRLLAGETHRVNQGVVKDPVPLRRALAEPDLELATRSGGWHAFDAETLARFRAGLSPLVAATLSVPLRFWVDHRMPGECAVTDEATREALAQHGLALGALRDGRAWVSLARAQAFARRWPGLVEFIRL